tara:strand:- start:129 stop:416 length:288 start_codon:yes stop_codon:yes gene_type:complete
MTNEQLINSFLAGNQNAQGRNALSIRNGALYSYDLKIAEHYIGDPADQWGDWSGIIIYNYQSDGIGFYSMTTSQHVGMIKRMVTGSNIITNVAPV